MKVVYLIPGFGGGGGAERSLAAMAPHLAREVDLHIVTFSDRDQLARGLDAAGVRFTNLSPAGRLDLIRQVRALLKREQPDILHTTLFEADIAGRVAALGLPRMRVVTSLVNVNYERLHFGTPGVRKTRLAVAWLLDALSARRVARFHALTSATADVMAKKLFIRRHRIEVIPRGREPAELGANTPARRERVRRSLGVGDEPLVIAAARHEYQKGLDILIRAAPLVLDYVPHALFLIGGRDGSQTEELHRLHHESGVGDRLRFLGQRSDVPDLMCAADVFVVPSRWEGFGSVLVEAMALGTRVVASDIPPIAEVAGDPPWLVLTRPENLHESIRGALVPLDENESRAIRARFLECYTARASADRTIACYRRALK